MGMVTVKSHRQCKPGSAVGSWHGRPEIEGTGRNATLWALTDQMPLRAGRDVRFTIRMTGQGGLWVRAKDPGGSPLAPVSGPTPGNVAYTRPGDGWTVVYRFPFAGCWHIKFHRSLSAASLWLSVR
ncbi:hypothetical protein [Actinomadura gamaensis]|uniref:Uncharacterized protein n=1 Tax=Actinomadura gamaensis TaxID=1763541 RepID=A0ABV9U6B3_9ACTN